MDPLMVCAKPDKPVSSNPTSIIVVLRIFWKLLTNLDLGGVLSACRRTTCGEGIQRRSAPATGQSIKTNLHTREDRHRSHSIPGLSHFFVQCEVLPSKTFCQSVIAPGSLFYFTPVCDRVDHPEL